MSDRHDEPDPIASRAFAGRVVERLRQAGHEAYWAGGCVRDQLLGLIPKDYDVATNALPEQVRACFGRRKTLTLGAAFGVVTLIGSKSEGNVEIATFRKDAPYSDGRHPDHVTFSSAQEDAQRRDFTINGLFYDPIGQCVIDFVGGESDLRAGIVRAIGDPHARIAEDKLRMLRAARFAARFDFALDPHTRQAIQREATTLEVVSAERIAMELRRMLVHDRRARAMELLRDLRLLDVILPESRPLWPQESAQGTHVEPAECAVWRQTLDVLASLRAPTFRVALAALLWPIHQHCPTAGETVEAIGRRWRLSNDETTGAVWLLAHEPIVRQASRVPWPVLQRVLIHPSIDELITFAQSLAACIDGRTDDVEYCRQKLQLPAETLNPAPLINGDDLRRAGLTAGPEYRRILTEVRDAQLEGRISSRDAAIKLARQLGHSED